MHMTYIYTYVWTVEYTLAFDLFAIIFIIIIFVQQKYIEHTVAAQWGEDMIYNWEAKKNNKIW